MKELTLEACREGIDRVDNAVLKLLNERMAYVKRVGEIKHTTGGAIYRPERERQIIERLASRSEGELTYSAIEAIFMQIIAVARNLELPEKVAFFEDGSGVSEKVAQSRFGKMSEYVGFDTIDAVFEEVKQQRAKFAVVPMENSDGGVVTQTLDNLMESHLKIIIKIATPNDATSTSYVVVSDFKNAQDEQAKTSFLVNLSNQYSAGSLFDFLADFKANAINIERIESKHAEYAKASPYSFYIEVHGHIDDENMKKVYETHQDTITWIGSYVRSSL